MTEHSQTHRIVLLASITALGVLVALAGGCAAEPLVAAEGEMTCIECHTDRDLLEADLEADPKPEKVVAESEGEG